MIFPKLFRGDAVCSMHLLGGNSVDLLIADLPYGMLNNGNPSASWDKCLDPAILWPEMLRVCKPTAPIILFGTGLFAAQLIMQQPKLYRYDLVWEKCGRCTGFLNAKRQPLRSHEQLLVFYREQPTYNPQMVKCDPSERTHSRGTLLRKPTNRCYGNFEATPSEVTDYKYPQSVIRIPKEHKEFYHPTQKPVALLEWLIKTYSNAGDTVLDPTMGSGSTMVATMNTGRSGIGIEIDEHYYDVARERCLQVFNSQPAV